VNIYRVLRTLSAHGYGQAISIASTLIIPAAIIAKWGALDFGYWVSLSALAQFFLMSDLGAATALANQLCLKSTRSDVDAWTLIQAVNLYVIKKIGVSIGIIIPTSLLIGFYNSHAQLDAHAFQLAVIFFCLALSITIQPVITVYCAVWRFEGKNEVGIFIANTVRLLESCIVVVTATLNGTLYAAAIYALIFKIVALSIMAYIMRQHALKHDINHTAVPDKNTLSELNLIVKAGHGFSLISLSQQLTLQGPVLLISTLAGPVAAAVFAACRTLSRVPNQPLNVLLASIGPELTDLISNQKLAELRNITKKIAVIIMMMSTTISTVAILNIATVEEIWLSGKLALDIKILIPLCIAGTLNLSSQVINQALTAANRTHIQSRQFIIASFLLICIMYPTLAFTKQPMLCGILIFFSEGIMTILLFKQFTLFSSELKK